MKIVKQKDTELEELRNLRKEMCFSIVNRGRLWYNYLTTAQLNELSQWYDDWLNVTETKVIPKRPVWLDDKLIKEEIL